MTSTLIALGLVFVVALHALGVAQVCARRSCSHAPDRPQVPDDVSLADRIRITRPCRPTNLAWVADGLIAAYGAYALRYRLGDVTLYQAAVVTALAGAVELWFWRSWHRIVLSRLP